MFLVVKRDGETVEFQLEKISSEMCIRDSFGTAPLGAG